MEYTLFNRASIYQTECMTLRNICGRIIIKLKVEKSSLSPFYNKLITTHIVRMKTIFIQKKIVLRKPSNVRTRKQANT